MYTYWALIKILGEIFQAKKANDIKFANWLTDINIHNTFERMQSRDNTWLREIESPMKMIYFS